MAPQKQKKYTKNQKLIMIFGAIFAMSAIFAGFNFTAFVLLATMIYLGMLMLVILWNE